MNIQQWIAFSIPALQAVLALLEKIAPGTPEATLAAMQLEAARGFESHASSIHQSTTTDCQHPAVVKLAQSLPPGKLTSQSLVAFAAQGPTDKTA